MKLFNKSKNKKQEETDDEKNCDVCAQPAHAEHARPMEPEEPCDDGRAG